MSDTTVKEPSLSGLQLIRLCTAAGLICGIIVLIASAIYERTSTERKGERALALVHDLHKSAIQDYVLSLKSEIKAMSNSTLVRSLYGDLTGAWNDLGDNRAETLQDYFVFPARDYGSAEDNNAPGDIGNYANAHLFAHQWARRVTRHFDFHDLFLISPAGDIIYSVEKELEFATNLRTGSYADTPLAQAYEIAIRRPDRTIISDSETYAPSEGRRSYFATHAIIDFNGHTIGVLAVQLKTAVLTEILAAPSILGMTGGSYISDTALQLIARSENLPILGAHGNAISNNAVDRAFEGFSGSDTIPGTNGEPSMAVYSPVDIGGVVWILVTEQNTAEIREDANYNRALLLSVLTALLSAGMMYAVFLRRRRA